MFESVILSGDLCSWLDRWWHLDVDETMVYVKEHGGLFKGASYIKGFPSQVVDEFCDRGCSSVIVVDEACC